MLWVIEQRSKDKTTYLLLITNYKFHATNRNLTRKKIPIKQDSGLTSFTKRSWESA